MSAISGANTRNRAQISAIGRKFRKEVWPIELKKYRARQFPIVMVILGTNKSPNEQKKNVAIEDPGMF